LIIAAQSIIALGANRVFARRCTDAPMHRLIIAAQSIITLGANRVFAR